MYDSYGDGINAGYGQGSFTITDGSGTVLASGGVFTDQDGDAFKTGSSVTPPASFNCVGFSCVDPGTGAGTYATLAACQAVCSPPASINETASSLEIYPNPAKNVLTIDGLYNSVDIFDVFGKLILTSEYQKNIDVSTLADGIYMLNIRTDKGILTQKITIAK